MMGGTVSGGAAPVRCADSPGGIFGKMKPGAPR